MAQISGQRSFRYSLRLRLAAIEGLRNVYYEYAVMKAQEMQQTSRDEQMDEGEDITLQWFEKERNILQKRLF